MPRNKKSWDNWSETLSRFVKTEFDVSRAFKRGNSFPFKKAAFSDILSEICQKQLAE